MTTQAVFQYLACTEIDVDTGDCTATVLVDAPTPVPPLTAEQGATIGGLTVCVWLVVASFGLIQRGAE